MALRFIEKKDLKDRDLVAGVCYAAAAEDIIRREFFDEWNRTEKYQPTVIGYLMDGASRMNDEPTKCGCYCHSFMDQEPVPINPCRDICRHCGELVCHHCGET